MSINEPQYPTSVWDGLSPKRNSRQSDRHPVYEDWDQVVAEVISTQIELDKARIHSHASYYLSAIAETSIGTVNVAVKAAGTTLSDGLVDFTMPENNRITYTGALTRHVHTAVSLSVSAASNNKIFNICLALNGVPLVRTKQTRKMTTSSDIGSLTLLVALDLSTDDYLEVWVENITDDTNITIESMYLTAWSHEG